VADCQQWGRDDGVCGSDDTAGTQGHGARAHASRQRPPRYRVVAQDEQPGAVVIVDDERDETLAASSERTAAHEHVDRSNTIGLATLPARTCVRARFPGVAYRSGQPRRMSTRRVKKR
jgi:hypothetical protein